MDAWNLILFALAAIFVGMQVRTMVRKLTQKGKGLPILPGEYGEALATGARSLFYFFGPSCSMCVATKQVIEKLQLDFPFVFVVDVSRDEFTTRAFGVRATPTIVLVENRRIRQFLLGFQPEVRLRSWLEEEIRDGHEK